MSAASSSLRLVVASFVVLMAVVACDDDPAASPGEDTATTVADVDPVSLRYGFEAGQEFVYDVDLDQALQLETSGSSTAVAEDDLPASADVRIGAFGTFTYTVTDVTEDGNLTVQIEGSFDDVTVEGTADGEPVESVEDVGQFGLISPVSRTVVIDRRGRVVTDTTQGADPLGLASLPLGGLAGDLGRVVGPVLPDEEVVPGESWTHTTQQAVFGEETVETTVTASVSSMDVVDGREVAIIAAATETGPLTVDLSEFFSGFRGAFGEGADTTAPAGDVVFRIDVEPASSESTTAFDPDAGIPIRSTLEGPSSLSMEVALPGESGDVERFDVSLSVDQTTTYTLR